MAKFISKTRPAKTRLATLALFVGIMAAPAASLHAQSGDTPGDIQTGLWEYKTKVAGITVETEMRCITPVEVAKFFEGPCNRHHTCVYPVKAVGNGLAKFEGYWQNAKGKRANVKANGAYSQRAFYLDIRGTTTNGLVLPNPRIEGRWTAPTCPAGTKK